MKRVVNAGVGKPFPMGEVRTPYYSPSFNQKYKEVKRRLDGIDEQIGYMLIYLKKDLHIQNKEIEEMLRNVSRESRLALDLLNDAKETVDFELGRQ